LYLVGTPIGNLEDITLRALRILKEVDLIACEDTRHTQKLLNHYDIAKRLVSYHEHNEMTRSPELLIKLEDGAKVALVSDAGMPLVSDPGYRLVALCVRHKIPVVPIPGPSALLAALSGSGLPSEEFLFVGFLPQRSAERRRMLEHLRIEERRTALPRALRMRAKSWATGQPASPAKLPSFMRSSCAANSHNWRSRWRNGRRAAKLRWWSVR
jgi:16S rRNA (cytidine1402-2'-O)-methyltransferase